MSVRWIVPLLYTIVCSLLSAEDAGPPMASLIQSSPEEFETRLSRDPVFARKIIPQLAQSLTEASTDPNRLLAYLATASKARALRISQNGGPWSESQINEILTLAFIDPNRFFGDDPAFQAIILKHLPDSIGAETPVPLRRLLLNTLSQVSSIEYDRLETISLGWEMSHRTSRQRELPFPALRGLSCSDGTSPLQALLFSFPSSMFDPEDCIALLSSVHQSSPNVALAVVSDFVTADSKTAEWFVTKAQTLGSHLIAPLGSPPSPWLRDPILVARDREDRLVFVNRAGPQLGREQDQNIPREFIRGLPAGFEDLTGPIHWSQAPLHFHGGHLLSTPRSVWISTHSIETRILQRLGLESINIPRLIEPSGWADFTDAVIASAADLRSLGCRHVQWVHPWPSAPAGMEHSQFVHNLGGGNDIDLDTLLTILPGEPADTALIGDPKTGATLLEQISDAELAEFSRRFEMGLQPGDLRRELTQWWNSPHVISLSAFQDLMESHLRSEGLRVRRTPILMVPTRLIAAHPKFALNQPHVHFPIGFSNVVLDSSHDPNHPAAPPLRAHCFESCLPTFDAEAGRVYAEAGCELILHPTLVESVISEGGFRCATQEIRQAIKQETLER